MTDFFYFISFYSILSIYSISLAICRWCDICIFNIRNEDVVVVVVIIQKDKRKIAISEIRRSEISRGN